MRDADDTPDAAPSPSPVASSSAQPASFALASAQLPSVAQHNDGPRSPFGVLQHNQQPPQQSLEALRAQNAQLVCLLFDEAAARGRAEGELSRAEGELDS